MTGVTLRALVVLALLALGLVGPVAAQEAEAPSAVTETAGPDYAAWTETAARAEALSEAGRGSSFALGQLRRKGLAPD